MAQLQSAILLHAFVAEELNRPIVILAIDVDRLQCVSCSNSALNVNVRQIQLTISKNKIHATRPSLDCTGPRPEAGAA